MNEWMNEWFIGRQKNIQQDTQVQGRTLTHAQKILVNYWLAIGTNWPFCVGMQLNTIISYWLWMKCGSARTIVLLACRANKGSPTLIGRRTTGVATLALASGSLTSLMPPAVAQCEWRIRGYAKRGDCSSLFCTLMSFSGSFDMASIFPCW